MIDIEYAEILAIEKLREIEVNSHIELAIMKEETVTFEFGWIFFYQSKEYIETNNMGAMIGGNTPIIVDKFNSSLHLTGTRMGEEYYLDMYCKYRNKIDFFYREIGYLPNRRDLF